MTYRRLPLFIFIDAFGWEILQRHPDFLAGLAPHRRKLDTLLGYSSACDPSIISGRRPEEHRLWSSFYYAPETSPFRRLRLLRFLPPALMNRGRVRHALSRVIGKIHGFTGYFQIYNVPFDRLPWFDYAEKKRIWEPGGLPVGGSIFDRLHRAGIDHYVHDSALPDEKKLELLREKIRARSIGFAYISLGKLDALMHARGPHSPEVTDLVRWYDDQIRSLVELARAHYAEVPFYVFTDHGMHDVRETVDLQAEVAALGIAEPDDYVAFYDSTMARFWVRSERGREALASHLGGHSRGRLLTDPELKELGVFFPDRQYGDLIFLVRPHCLIVPSYMGAKKIAGMHGYHPESPDAAASMTSNRELPPELRRIEQIYSLMEREVEWPDGGNASSDRAAVLVLDDDDIVRESIQLTLSRHYAVYSAPDVPSAEQILREHSIDILVCDDHMPGETGLMFMARIKDRYPALRRILVSGHLDKEMLTYATNHAEILRVIEKPFQAGELLDVVGRSLARAPGPPPAVGTGDRVVPAVLRWMLYGVLCIGGLALLAAVSGCLVVFLLYGLKSLLGIDVFKDVHFRDLIGW